MGIAVSELLTLDYFKDFRVLAGSAGLNREVQGITVLDAPDSFRWMKGKEMILSNGFALVAEPDCVLQAYREGYLTQMACMVVKAGRYLVPIPAQMLQIFEENGIPLLEAPFSVAYMELMHQANTAIMNKTTKRFCFSGSDKFSLGDDSYKERKLRRILQAVEGEMHFPALLYDLGGGVEYVSSVNFRRIADGRGLRAADFWEPAFLHSQQTLCDTLHMVRFRVQEELCDQPRFSWITVPISFAGTVQAYFVVLESRDLIDFYDEYAIRIATLLLQSVYEQMIVAQNVGDIGFENLIHLAVRCGESDPQQLITQAGTLHININEAYRFAVFVQRGSRESLSQNRGVLSTELRSCFPGETIHFAFLQPERCLLMLRCPKNGEATGFCKKLEELARRLETRFPGLHLAFGSFGQTGTLLEAAQNIRRCTQALRLGQLLYPQKVLWQYEDFGPLAWLNLEGDEMEMMRQKYGALLCDSKNQELLATLKVYLASNMSFSETAEKLYVHINTIRKRMERVRDLLDLDWSDSFARMKLELLLQLMGI